MNDPDMERKQAREATAQEAQAQEAALDSLLGADDATLGELVTKFTTLGEQISKMEKEKDDLKTRIMSTLDGMGATSVKVAGRRVGITERTYYGLDKTQIEAAKAWMEQVAPEANVPAAANVGKAVEAYLDANPGAALPAFVTSSVTRILTNAKG